MLAKDACLRFFLDALWPQTCPLCERWLEGGRGVESRSIHTLYHRDCLRRLPREELTPSRPRRPGEGVPVCAWLRDDPGFFRLLHAAKYGGRPSLLVPLAEALAAHTRAAGWIPRGSIIVPVPDDPRRLAERGFSPVAILGAEIASRLRCGLRGDLIRRRRPAGALASVRNASARRQHHEELWGVGRLSEVPPERSLILLDDQITTGSTARSLVRLLGLRGNPLLVLCLAAARAAPRQV